MLQNSIKNIRERIGWSHKRLAWQLFQDLNEDSITDEDILIQRFEEKLKKDLSRPSVKSETLSRYLRILNQNEEVKRLDIIIPHYIASQDLDEEVKEGLKDISAKIDKSL